MIFKFKAYLVNGSEDRGVMDAPSKQEALRLLSAKGRSAFFLEEVSVETKAIKDNERTPFRLNAGRVNPTRLFYDLAMLTDAGLTITQSLRSVRATEPDRAQRKAIETIEAAMSSGKTASQSFALVGDIPRDALGLIASGESAGRLPSIFKSLAAHHEERQKARSAMIAALAYPAFLFVLMALAIGVITFVLVPSIEPIFENADRPAPFIIDSLSQLRMILEQCSILFIALLIGLGCLSFVPQVRDYFQIMSQRMLLRLPIAGSLITKRGLSQYLSSLSILLEHGGTMANALLLSAECSPVAQFRPILLKVRDKVTSGSALTPALRESGLFDERILSLIAVGDEANRLPLVAAHAANIIQDEAQARLSKFLSALTPAITIVLGLLIGGLVVSVMSALLSINDLALQ